MEFSVPMLAVSTRGVHGRVGSTRGALRWLAERGCADVVVDATPADVRPRSLDRAARRELAAAVKRGGQRVAGLDLLIPAEHFESGALADRAVGAVLEAIGLAADLRGFEAAAVAPVVCVSMSPDPVGGVVASLEAASERDGVRVACVGGAGGGLSAAIELGPLARMDLDAATRVAEAGDRLGAVRVDRFDRRTLAEVAACVGAMSVSSPDAIGVADLTDSADPGRALDACVSVWRGPLV